MSIHTKSTPTDKDLLSRKISDIKRSEPEMPFLQRLKEFVESTAEHGLYRINLNELSDIWLAPVSDLLQLFLMATKVGVFDMHWDIHCPLCSGITSHNSAIHTLTANSYCGACAKTFESVLDQNIEISFTVNSNIRNIDIPNQDNALSDEHTHSYLRGFDIILSPIYRKYFSGDVLSENENLVVKHIAIMFTDIKGSTKLYQDLGDSEAYKLVKKHFDVLDDAIMRHQGVIVKTIGDSVMASFAQTFHAISAAIDAQNSFREFNFKNNLGKEIAIRVGIHVGSSLVVTLNNRLDYFGTMVNIASRVQALADGKEIMITKNVFDDLGVRHEILHKAREIKSFKARLKGIDQEQQVLKIYYE